MADPQRVKSGTNAGAAVLLIALIGGLLVWQHPWRDEQQPVDRIPRDAQAVLERQFDALSDAHSERAFVRAAGPDESARRFARQTWTARRELGIVHVDLDYQRGGDVADRADGTTSARVLVRWASADRAPWGGTERIEVPVRFRLIPHDRAFAVASATATDGRPLPPWLAGEVAVDRFGQSSVVTISNSAGSKDAGTGGSPQGGAAAGAAAMARRAVTVVGRTWPGASERLCVIVPSSPAVTAGLLGHARARVQQLAAVTTPIGGTTDAPAVVINPEQWATMDAVAQQVVMTHEAVHALTGAVGRHVDTLVAEGFADYVALHDDRRPLAITAGQILRRVKVSGPPDALPTADDFGESAEGLGAVYESAWLLFRMLGDDFGPDAVVRLYRLVLDGADFASAVRSAFGIDLADLTTKWRAYLTKSASTMS